MMAGTTANENKAPNESGNSNKSHAEPRKTTPDKIVQSAARIGALIVVGAFFLINKNNPKNANAVIGLSIRLGICPAGNPVVNAVKIPVPTDNNKTFFFSGNNIIPKNINGSAMSGFIPAIGGITK